MTRRACPRTALSRTRAATRMQLHQLGPKKNEPKKNQPEKNQPEKISAVRGI